MDRITTTIKRRWLDEIIAGIKKIEYRTIKQYWETRLEKVSVPFELRMINGMSKKAPEVTVKIRKVRRNSRLGQFELHIEKIVGFRNWDAKRRCPSS